MERTITAEQTARFAQALQAADRAPGTIENYLRHIRAFARWLGDRPLLPESAAQWRDSLLEQGYTPGTVNSMIGPLNRFFQFLGWNECKAKQLRIQRQLFRENQKELTRGEYHRLLSTAQSSGRERLALLMEAICATGIRVSEVQYLTVESVRAGKAEISLKGKIRTILIPGKLRKKLLSYTKRKNTASGPVFRTRSGCPISRKQIWAEMKSLCKKAGVAASKVFPHNLRHLFARVFYQASRDVAKLADVLGHSSIETTRIYLISTGREHERTLNRLGLVT
ncbi:MAG TPA: site-specific integrase [Candidatus Acutalibacter pullistercoris]|uniref:Site-specific integrase n=1 Tax=Candidatus Acutalibacter pullistercoris TaxID=2838418 RepID=A0A9D1YDR4_9FIRM|nr:site-specific integrase [Candidatus Acutalibacter pullistercoris]